MTWCVVANSAACAPAAAAARVAAAARHAVAPRAALLAETAPGPTRPGTWRGPANACARVPNAASVPPRSWRASKRDERRRARSTASVSVERNCAWRRHSWRRSAPGTPRGRQRHEVHGTAGQKHHLVTRAEGDGTEGFGTPLAVAVAGGGGGGARGGSDGGERRGESREGSDVAVPGVDGFPGVGEDEEVFASGEPTRVGVGLVGAAPGGMPTPRRFGRGRMRSGGGGGGGDGVRLGDRRSGGGVGVVQAQARWIGGDDSRSASVAVIVDRGRKRASRPSQAPSREFRARARRVDHGRGVARRRGGVARQASSPSIAAFFSSTSRRGHRRARDDGLHHTRRRRAAEWCARDATPAIPPVTMPALALLVASSSLGRLVNFAARLFRPSFEPFIRVAFEVPTPAVPAARHSRRPRRRRRRRIRAWSPFSRIPSPLSARSPVRATLPRVGGSRISARRNASSTCPRRRWHQVGKESLEVDVDTSQTGLDLKTQLSA